MTPEDWARQIHVLVYNAPGCSCRKFDLCPQHRRVAEMIRAAIAEEREACAKIADADTIRRDCCDLVAVGAKLFCHDKIAAAIRARI